MPFVALDQRYRLVLPKEIRDQLDFKPGGPVYLEVRDGYLYVAPIDDPYVLMTHEQFLAEAERLEREQPIENYPELMQELAEWDAIPDDWLEEFPYDENVGDRPSRGSLAEREPDAGATEDSYATREG